MKNHFNHVEHVRIQEAADILGVSSKTLRRWEASGKLVPERSEGNQRYYSREQVDNYKTTLIKVAPLKQGSHLTSPKVSSNPIPARPFSARFAGIIRPFAYVLVASFLISLIVFKPPAPRSSPSEVGATTTSTNVLAAATQNLITANGFSLKVNVPALFEGKVNFADLVNFAKDITAPNIIYSITAGSGIGVSAGQTPTITNTGVTSLGGSTGSLSLAAGAGISVSGLTVTNSDLGSSQYIFKTIKVGTDSFKATTNTDILEFVASGEAVITPDIIGKKLTFYVPLFPAPNYALSGWTRTGMVVGLTTLTDSVNIGSSAFTAGAITGTTGILTSLDVKSGGITKAGSITGAYDLTSSGEIRFSSLDTGVAGIVHSSDIGVLSSRAVSLTDGDVSGVLPVGSGGTGLTGYTPGGLIYATGSANLKNLGIGSPGQVLVVSAGNLPAWGSISGESCIDCLVTDPGTSQIIFPTSTDATGLIVRQKAGGSVDIFQVTSAGGTSYLKVDSSGNIVFGNGTISSLNTGIFSVNPAGSDPISISPVAMGGAAYTGTITSADLTQPITWTFPNETGTVCLGTGNCIALGIGVSGSGTVNKLAKWESTSGLTDSLLYANDTQVGINTTDLFHTLEVAGTASVSGAVNLGSILGVTGATTLSSTLGVTGAVNFLSTLGVTGATTLSSTVGIGSDTTISGNLMVNGGGNSYFSTGKVGIGTINPTSLLSVGADSQFQVDSNGDIVELNNLAYTSWPTTHVAGGFLQDNGTGGLSWTTTLPSVTTIGFDKITSGTNTTAAMVVDTGASLTYSGGTINASSLEGKTWEAPGTIGFTTPNTGAFTTLSANSTGNALTLSGIGANIAFTGAGLAQITTATNQNLAIMPGGTGLVGIGTIAPTENLTVVGSIAAQVASDTVGLKLTDVSDVTKLGIKYGTGTVTFNIPSASTNVLQIANSTTGLGQLNVESTSTLNSGSASLQALIVKGYSGQTVNLQEWQNSAGTVLSYVDALGGLSMSRSTNSLTAYNFKNSTGISVLDVDTLNGNVGIGTTTPGAALAIGGGAIISDTFTRANAAIGNAETPVGLAWTGSTWTVSGNTALNTPTLTTEMVDDTGFGTPGNWTAGTNWGVAGGVGTKTAGTQSNLYDTAGTSAAVGTWYSLTATFTVTAGTATLGFNGGDFSATSISSAGTYTRTLRSLTSTGKPAVQGDGTFAGTVDNFSSKPLTLSTLFSSLTYLGPTDSSVTASVQADATVTAGTQAGIVMNLDNAATPANFVIAYTDGTKAYLDKNVAGTYTNLISTAVTYAAGATIKVVKSGTSYSLYYNGAQVSTTQTISDAGIASGTLFGLFSTYSGNTLDNFNISTNRPTVYSTTPTAPTVTLGGELATGNLVIGNWYAITATTTNYFFTGCAIGNVFRATATTALDANDKVKLATLSTLSSTVTYNGSTDITVQANPTITAGTQGGIIMNLDAGGTNFVIAYTNGTNIYLDKSVGGTYTNLITTAITYVAGQPIQVVKSGTSYALYYNSVQKGTTQTITDAGIINNTLDGLFSTYASNTFTGFAISAVPTFAFTNFANAGIFSSITSTLNFTTAGLERLRIDASGNIGIGTTAPTNKLQVEGSIASDVASGVQGLKISTNGITDMALRYVTTGTASTSYIDTQTSSSNNKFTSNTNFDTGITGWDYGNSLEDQFTTARAVGAVNDTSAEPTGGTRTVVDGSTPKTISITAGGLLNFATGETINDGLWYASQARAAGKILIQTVIPSNTSGIINVGFATATSGAINDRFVFDASGVLNMISNGGTAIAVGTYTANTYYVAGVMRATGFYWYIKGGAFTSWTLLYITAAGTAAGYPAINVGSTTSVFTADNIKIPTNLWLPTPLAYDTFTTDTGFTSTETTGPDVQTTPSLAWAQTAGTWGVTGGVASASALSGSAFATVNSSSSDVLIDTVIPTYTGGVAGIVARYQDANNYLIAYYDGTNVKLDQVVGGSTTPLLTATATWGAGYVLRLVLSGTTARLYYNNIAIGATPLATVPSSTYTLHGLYTTNTGNTFDNFTLWARSGYTDLPDTNLTITAETGTTYGGSAGSTKIIASGDGGAFTQSINVGDTASYTLSAAIYTDGTAVTSASAEMFSGSNTLATTFTSLGSDWYRAQATVTGVASAKAYGVYVHAGKTIYIDNMALISSTGVASVLNVQNTLTGLGQLSVESTTTINTGLSTLKGLIVKGAASQTANLQEWQNSTGGALAYIGANGLLNATTGGLATFVKAGTISDTDFADAAVDGMLAVDSLNNKLYIRDSTSALPGGPWHWISFSAGFQIPDYEAYSYNFDTKTFDTTKPLEPGDFLIPFVEKSMEDGALHGLYAKFSDVKGMLFATEEAQLASISAQLANLSNPPNSPNLPNLVENDAVTFKAQVEFQGPAVFRAIAEFFDTVIFHSGVTFEGHATFNNDTAGFAVIPGGANQVDVAFDKVYDTPPVVTAFPLWDTGTETLDSVKALGNYILPEQNYIIANAGAKGFTIILDVPAVTDLKFGWNATAVTNAKTTVGVTPSPSPSPAPTPKASPVEASPSASPI